jgi:steroid delta-isomerase-like uncharacterized protein
MTGHKSGSASLDEAVASEFVKRLGAIFNAHDLDAFSSLMAEDVVFDHPLAGTMHGRGEIRAFYTRFWSAFPDLAVDLADGPFLHPHAARPFRRLARHRHPHRTLDPPGLPATGRHIQGHVWETLEIRDGHLHRIGQAFDTAGFMRQLGVLPAQGSRAERAMAAMQRLRVKLSRRD